MCSMKTVIYTRKANKDLVKIPAHTADRIRAKVEQYAKNPTELANNIKKLQGYPYYRLRVGDYRVVFDENGRVIEVIAVKPRGGAYK